jgi:eukaryotic-like serine/threonine-protein kinase
VGPYELLLPIAAGGMATVFLARHHGAGGFRREVALKLLHPHLRLEPHVVEELLEEARLAALLRHPNVVPVLDARDDPEAAYLVMDYVEGDTVAGLIERAEKEDYRLPEPVNLRILSDVLEGLEAAHQLRGPNGRCLGLVHRDVSPQNILVGVDGIARLTDFGIAKASSRLALTRTGLVKGKVGYMAPEQARGQPLDQRCDVWAAGVVAWELFAGRRLFGSDNDIATAVRLLEQRPPRLRSVRADVPAEVDDAVAFALVPEADLRCPTAGEFLRRLSGAGPVASQDDVAEVVSMLTENVRLERRSVLEQAPVLAPELAGAELTPSPVDPVSKRGWFYVAAAAVAVGGLVTVAALWPRSAGAPPPRAGATQGNPDLPTRPAAPERLPPSNTPEVASALPSDQPIDAPSAKTARTKAPRRVGARPPTAPKRTPEPSTTTPKRPALQPSPFSAPSSGGGPAIPVRLQPSPYK